MLTLDNLILDHNRLRKLLELFEGELSLFEAGYDVDLQLIEDIVSHYAEYFNRVHHPAEDRLFEYLVQQGLPDLQNAEQAIMEHAELETCTNTVLQYLADILHGGMVLRPRFIAASRQFILKNREHMANEEETVFAWARDRLSPDEWREIGARDVTRTLDGVGCERLLGEPVPLRLFQ
jgi:hemerythrin-like domain-containing protein